MRLTAVIIDSRPFRPGDGDERGPSLLLAPYGSGSLLSHWLRWLRDITDETVSVLPSFAPERSYDQAIRRTRGVAILTRAEFQQHLCELEPSDWVLLLDPRHFAAVPPTADAVRAAAADLRWITHWVALESTADEMPEEMKESVELDEFGQVSRMERYYAGVTWPRTCRTAFSLLPGATMRLIDAPSSPLDMSSIAALRASLIARDITSREVALAGATLDLTEDGAMARLIERSVRELTAGAEAARWMGRGSRIDPTARVLGALVLQDGASIGAGATIAGPTLIGAGARVGAGAVVVQCALADHSTVARGRTVRHLVIGDGESVPDDPAADRRPEQSLDAAPGIEQAGEPQAPGARTRVAVKRALDVLLASLALALLLPLFAVVALAVKLGRRGPVFLGSVREGAAGVPFSAWKFRTMIDGAHALQRGLYKKNDLDGPQFKLDHDARVTRVGRWLRSANIDELPQLWNVLVGEMSLVGPRPLPFRENQICVPWRRARLSVPPGITGLWQVCRHERSSGDFHQWIEYDVLYVSRVSLWLDLRILLATVGTAGGKWSVPLSWMVPGETA